MRKKINVLILIFIILFGSGFILLNPDNYVKGIEFMGDYWAIFEEYSIGTNYINETIDGVKWLEISPVGTPHSFLGVQNDNKGGKSYRFHKLDGSSEMDFDFDLFHATDRINYSIYCNTASEERWYFHQYFYNGANEQVLHLLLQDFVNGNSSIQMLLYDSENDLIFNRWLNDVYVYVDVYFNLTTGYVGVDVDKSNKNYPVVWFEATNIDYISNIHFDTEQVTGLTWTVNFYHFWINVGGMTVVYPWELDYDSYGNLFIDNLNLYQNLLGSSSTEWVAEITKDNFYSNITVHQIALKIESGSTYTNTEAYARIGNQLTSNYSSIYSLGEDYVLCWEDLSLTTGYYEDMLLEFKFNYDDSNQAIHISRYPYDTDSDGDYGHKYSPYSSYFNGLYDGYYSDNSADLVYQVWYTLGTGGGGNESNQVYVTFKDLETLQKVTLYGSDYSSPPVDDSINGLLKSNQWTGEYYAGKYDNPHTLEFEFTQGEVFTLEITGLTGGYFMGKIDGEFKTMKCYPLNTQIYGGETLTMWVADKDYGGTPDYPNCDWEPIFYGIIPCYVGRFEICFNKFYYDYGETIRARYILPALYAFEGCRAPTSGWQLRIYKAEGNMFDSKYRIWTFYQDNDDFKMNGKWNQIEWLCNETVSETLGSGTGYPDLYQKYKVGLYHDTPWDNDVYTCCHWCSGEDFEPDGTIVSITPSPARIFQQVSIVYNANNFGKLVLNVQGVSHGMVHPFSYQEGNFIWQFNPDMTGIWDIDLWVYGSDGYENVNGTTLTVTDEQGGYGDTGYNIEYCYCILAGNNYIKGSNDSITIAYRTLNPANSTLSIYSPRGARTYFSTSVNMSGRQYSFKLPHYVEIGVWRVVLNNTLYCYPEWDCEGHWLNDSFNVIAEENNWVEFGKNVYYDNEPFTIRIKHTYYVAITFYKWNEVYNTWQAQGESIRWREDEHPREITPIEVGGAVPKEGRWKVSLERINDELIQYLLAEDECLVEHAMTEYDYQGYSGLPKLETALGAVVGLILTMFCLLAPLIIAKGLHVKTGVPPMAYSFSGSIGVVVAVLFGWFPFWVIAFVIMITIIMIITQYVMKNIGSSGGEG